MHIRDRQKTLALIAAKLKAIDVRPLVEWDRGALILERPGASCVHHVRQAVIDRDTYLFGAQAIDERQLYWPEVISYADALAESNCFVVEHNWAAALAGSGAFESGDIRLPYENCVFDFKISSHRVVALVTTHPDSNNLLMQITVEWEGTWFFDSAVWCHREGEWRLESYGNRHRGSGRLFGTDDSPLSGTAKFVGAQIKAITIALDAEVAETSLVRVSEKLVRNRTKTGRVAPKLYNVVTLARRKRSCPAFDSAALPGCGSVRLHFRRGHWRHFEEHKTWIRWMLVGNPDIGFVEKEYRL